MRMANYLLAERLAEQALKENPQSAEANFMLFAARGRRLLAQGSPSITNFWRFSDVNKYLTRTLELNPNHANALAAKGGLLLDLPSFLGGSTRRARALLERAVALNPTGVATRVTLARALLRQGEREPARTQLRLAAHYACVVRRRAELLEAERLLTDLEQGRL